MGKLQNNSKPADSPGAASCNGLITLKTEAGKKYITFGSYEAVIWDWDEKKIRSGSKRPLEWEILTFSPGKKRALVLCKDIVAIRPYNDEPASVTWEKCTLRRWLNREFFETAFSAGERELIVPTVISNPKNEKYGTEGGNDTEDRIFLLSSDEVWKYLPSQDRRLRVAFDGCSWFWWLRSPGCDGNFAVYVDDGTVDADEDADDEFGGDVSDAGIGVCPAFWINLNP